MIESIQTAQADAHATYLINNHGTLIIHSGDTTLNLAPAQALELLKFVERTGYQANANALVKGGAA